MTRRPITTLAALAVAGLMSGAATAQDPHHHDHGQDRQGRYDSAQYDYDNQGSPQQNRGDFRSASLTSAYGSYRGNPSYDVNSGRRQATNVPFDEQYYLRNNPDVARVVLSGAIRSGYEHYLANGRFEGRSPAPGVPGRNTLAEEQERAQERDAYAKRAGGMPFDERYYLAENPDVAKDVRSGVLPSGYQHYLDKGQYEGRSPAPGVPGTHTARDGQPRRPVNAPRSLGSRF